ncbi:hypothetical protein FBU30_010447 [Linnemannia zychae]|nr:hypothetical protein FBU30_010447 [Linnemannia zychae]
MAPDDDLQENVQPFRAVYKNIHPIDIAPARPNEIFYLDCYNDLFSQRLIVMWEDIQHAFKNALLVRQKARIVPFLKDNNLKILEPRRIAAIPDTVLDVVVDDPTADIASTFSQVSITPSIAERSPVFGLEEIIRDNSEHDIHISMSPDRGPHAILDEMLPTLISNSITMVSQPDSNDSSHSYSQSITDTSESKLAHLMLKASQGDMTAQVTLGHMHRDGTEIVKQDYQSAMYWYCRAAEQDDMVGQFNVGVLYGIGLGVIQDYTKAILWYRKAADQGHALAQYSIGYLYEHGHGVQLDYLTAMSWYLKAANQGNSHAQLNIGIMYDNGLGVHQNYSTAMSWFLKAADQGCANAQSYIGYLYSTGRGVEQDYLKALTWYQKAADQGFSLAQYNVGFLYFSGGGIHRDYSQAMSWFRKAADQGLPDAQYLIGVMYDSGSGVPRDKTQARSWYQKAADQGHQYAKDKLGCLP